MAAVSGLQTNSLDEVLEKLYKERGWRLVALVFGLCSWFLVRATVIYGPAIAGRNPKNWTCLSEHCTSLHQEWMESDPSENELFPCKDQEDKAAKFGSWRSSVDYSWIPVDNKTSFSIDLDLVCYPAKHNLVSSIFFIGALLGLLIASCTLDILGRKRSALLWISLLIAASLLGFIFANYFLLLLIRFVQGAAVYAVDAAIMVLLQETFPTSQRNTANNLVLMNNGAAMFIFAALAYLITHWQHFYLAVAVICIALAVPMVLAPESPRFYLLRGDIAAAEQSLRYLVRLSNLKEEEVVGCLDPPQQDAVEEKVVSLDTPEQDVAKESKRSLIPRNWNRVVVLESLGLVLLWTIMALSNHALNFGWTALLPDPYLGYLVNGFSEVGSSVALTVLADKAGRRLTMVGVMFLAAVFIFTALCHVPLFGEWTVSSLASLIAKLFIQIGYCGTHLWTAEIPPASHLGFVLSGSMGVGRLGGFFGPMMFGALAHQAGQDVPLYIMGGLLIFAGAVSLSLVETKGIPRVLTPEDVLQRRKEQRFLSCVPRGTKTAENCVIANKGAEELEERISVAA